MVRVLVVDDDQGIRRIAEYSLAAAGFDVTLAGNGREALEQVRRDHPDIVVLDLNMPVMDGYTFFHEVERNLARPRILILSGDQAAKVQKDLGADASLQKPFRPDDLVARVEKLSAQAK